MIVRYSATTCPVCEKVFTPRTSIQVNCSSACANKKRDKKHDEKRKAQSAMKGTTVNQALNYQITNVLPHDLDMLYASFTGLELDAMLEMHSLPECAELKCKEVRYEVYSHTAGNGRTYQRLVGDNGRVIMSVAEKRVTA